jgi:hypothetical protein
VRLCFGFGFVVLPNFWSSFLVEFFGVRRYGHYEAWEKIFFHVLKKGTLIFMIIMIFYDFSGSRPGE